MRGHKAQADFFGTVHTIGTPLALASEDFASKFWIRYDEIPALRSPNIRVLHGSVKSVDPERKVATYLPYAGTEEKQLEYDFLVAATGLRRAWPAVPQSLRRKQYLFEMGDHLRSMTGRKKGVVVVVGGGMSSPSPPLKPAYPASFYPERRQC
jgi:NADH dehydrogenase, FAD-containing subunit